MFARVFPLLFLAVVLARLAGVGDGLVTLLAMTLTRQGGSAKRQRSQTKRNNDCPNQLFHNVIFVSFTLADASDANRLQLF
jgi:hypothetical protein